MRLQKVYFFFQDSSFITEVHHITGKGEDAGVVYSEMQARENSRGDTAWINFSKEMYPNPSGYRFQTGGKLANLRNSTTIDKVII